MIREAKNKKLVTNKKQWHQEKSKTKKEEDRKQEKAGLNFS
jgi:hypothetical protein